MDVCTPFFFCARAVRTLRLHTLPLNDSLSGNAGGFSATAPIRRIISRGDVPVETAERPIAHLFRMPMLDRVVMDVIDMPLQIDGVADLMFPIPPLPNAFFTAPDLARAAS